MQRVHIMLGLVLWLSAGVAGAQEAPYFVTYTHHMEEPGSLELESKSAIGKPNSGNRFLGVSNEFEYGTTAWWTSELYLDVTATSNEDTVFGGFRIENRIRPLWREHWINPVLYVEFEDINEADKSILEVVGHDGQADLLTSVNEARHGKQREAELKLILSSDARGWNFSENLIFEKNLNHSPWEFGYALGASRPLQLKASPGNCVLCPENLALGGEMYGGLGDRYSPGTSMTSHYIGPVGNWQIPKGPRLSTGVGFGLNDYSLPRIYRVGIAYELGQVRSLFRTKGGH